MKTSELKNYEEGIYGDAKVNALLTFRNCFHKIIYGVVETVEEEKSRFPHAPIVMWDEKIIQE